MTVDDPAVLHQIEAVDKHRVGLGRKPCDNVGTDGDFGSLGLHPLDKFDRKFATVPPLHPLQDHIIACLQRQMYVRHQARFAGNQVEKPVVDFDTVNRRQSQTGQGGDMRHDPLDQLAQIGLAGQIMAIAGDIDAGQDDLVKASVD